MKEPTFQELASFTNKPIETVISNHESSKIDTIVEHKCDVLRFKLDKLSSHKGVQQILDSKITHQELAEFVGISREAIWRKSKNTKNTNSYKLHVLAFKLAKVKELLRIK